MENFQEIFETGLKFHGHKCPAMPMGLKAGLAAMKALGVERSRDKELYVKVRDRQGTRGRMFSGWHNDRHRLHLRQIQYRETLL